MKDNRYQELIFGIIIAAFDIFYFIMTLRIPRKDASNVFDARFFPYLLCAVFTILAVFQILAGIRNLKQAGQSPKTEENEDTVTVLKALGSILVYILLMSRLGFIVSTILFLLVMFALLCPVNQKKNYFLYLVVAIVFTLFVYVIFRYVLKIILPQGILTFI